MRPRGCACFRACAFVRFEAPYTLACVPRRRTRREQRDLAPGPQPCKDAPPSRCTCSSKRKVRRHLRHRASGNASMPPRTPHHRRRIRSVLALRATQAGPLRSVNGNHRRIKADPAALRSRGLETFHVAHSSPGRPAPETNRAIAQPARSFVECACNAYPIRDRFVPAATDAPIQRPHSISNKSGRTGPEVRQRHPAHAALSPVLPSRRIRIRKPRRATATIFLHRTKLSEIR